MSRISWRSGVYPFGWHDIDAAWRMHTGYLVLEDFASPEETVKVKARAEQIIEDYDASNPSVFSTVNQVRTCWRDTVTKSGSCAWTASSTEC